MSLEVLTRKGCVGRAHARFALVQGLSTCTASEASYPLKLIVQRPVSLMGGFARFYVISYGGGVVAGDNLQLDVEVEAHASALLSTQSSTKIFKK